MANVTAKNVKAAIRELVHPSAEIHTDENRVYQGLGNEFAGHGVSATAPVSMCATASTTTPLKAATPC